MVALLSRAVVPRSAVAAARIMRMRRDQLARGSLPDQVRFGGGDVSGLISVSVEVGLQQSNLSGTNPLFAMLSPRTFALYML